MGSLMSGWSSSVLSDKEVRLMRNRSLTKDEVEAFWRKHGGRPAEKGEETRIPLAARQLKVMRSMPPLRGGIRSDDDPCGGRQNRHLFPRSEPSSPAATATRGERCFVFPENADDDVDTSSTSRGWWTRSSWAFLNEPPPKEEALLGRAHQISFACDQFHAARIVTGNA
ncbi:unnamed protein product [Urochloa decumbens]|uniref:Uncharacterized protein n=1 Tax=Urochloa decumbens TaxID=240449 RepID=A0ABC8XPR8_9POAL